jgi:SulP family sulfate permease
MTSRSPSSHDRIVPPRSHSVLQRYVPLLDWLPNYRPGDLVGDVMAGIIVAIMLVPQGMAYAMLAGLPPQIGLYASILPLMLYAVFGTSRALAVGPVAMVSLMVASSVGQLAVPGSDDYIAIALTLALLVGVIQVLMGVVRLGFVVNFLSHSVIVGFTNAAALVIGLSQFKHLLGVSIPRSESFFETVHQLWQAIPQTNLVTFALGIVSIVILLFFSKQLPGLLQRGSVSPRWIVPLSRSGPLVVVMVTTVLVLSLGLHTGAGVNIVGEIPQGFPPFTTPTLNQTLLQQLAPTALTISFVGFMESIAVAKSLASKRRQRIDANQELIGLGAANIGAAFTGGYPVTGGFSRSVVNFTAGANTGLASIITALLMALVVLFFTPLFYYLPQATLAAVILVAVANLLDFQAFRHLWQIDRADAWAMVITFMAVLTMGIELGIVAGFIASVVFFLWRTSHPHIAEVGRIGQSEHFRNINRHDVQTSEQVLAVRIDENLYFANTHYLEEYLLQAIADHPQAQALLINCTAINHVDASALETLERLFAGFREAGIEVYLSDVKGPVMDQFKRSHFDQFIGTDHIFLSTHLAMEQLVQETASTTAPEEG